MSEEESRKSRAQTDVLRQTDPSYGSVPPEQPKGAPQTLQGPPTPADFQNDPLASPGLSLVRPFNAPLKPNYGSLKIGLEPNSNQYFAEAPMPYAAQDPVPNPSQGLDGATKPAIPDFATDQRRQGAQVDVARPSDPSQGVVLPQGRTGDDQSTQQSEDNGAKGVMD